tara:strand:+ start:162 stop:611 length:450 start_codon:yes stop_codon:yes gene_type:complete
MNISRSDLYRIILEEYAKEEGIGLSESKADELLRYIKGGPKPDWIDDEREAPDPPEVPAAKEPAGETIPMPRGEESLVDQISALVQGMDPEQVSELFQAVFAQIPGVEMGPAEEEPETLYSPGAEGRPQVGFKLEELMDLIREVLAEDV